MSTATDTHKTEIASREYARKFHVETAARGKRLEPMDTNLAETLKDCALRPHPERFPSIRRVLADEYGITLWIERIIRQEDSSEKVVAGVAALLKTRMTTWLMDDYRAAQRIGGEFASEVRRWITAELIHRIGREAVVAFEQRAANEVKERAITAREARKGDVYVTRDNGLYDRREITNVKLRRSGALVDITFPDHTTRLLKAEQPIVVEREEDDSRDTETERHEDNRALGGVAEEEAGAREREESAGERDPETSSATSDELLGKYRAACRERDHGAGFDTRCIARSEVGWLTAEFRKRGLWVFNSDFHDFAQIIPFIDDYWTIYEEIKAEGKYPYNSSFEGRIAGLENALPREETPIYLLQQLRGLVEGHDYLAKILDAGYRRLTELTAQERFASVVVFDRFYAAQRYDDARVIPDDEHRLSALLPKGKRTRGPRLGSLDQVYVR
jgi:hypothetical protein